MTITPDVLYDLFYYEFVTMSVLDASVCVYIPTRCHLPLCGNWPDAY